jgi:HrpA-like RNA helicase
LENSSGHRKMMDFRDSLPASQFKEEIISHIQNNQVICV